tara:strand:+ start:446 stop:907 length:462 start_codon:yes stop_codon:yes gene_type:complete
MATLNAALTLNSTDAFASQEIALSATMALTVTAPMADVSVMATSDDPFGHGAGVIIDEEDTNSYFVYIKHTNQLESDDYTGSSTTASADATDTIIISNGDADAGSNIITLKGGEFCLFPTTVSDGSDGGIEVGGIKVAAGNSAVILEYAFFKR